MSESRQFLARLLSPAAQYPLY